ncbi:uncharacterized protein LOC119073310 isoform X2 [Bradysia coprophila]|uniref:uncharacterized protein LOC119073310 isoform X2 n=1 Tax=Bradysia coprophila TaxID=38358 RepID=UPI00187D7B0D|nr:uncharacterized protein LOC119073310 isoform X2 [Bradysia coprophila]
MNNRTKRVFLNVDYYGFLGVPPWATEAEIRKNYRRLQLKHHTDKDGDLTTCLLLNEIKRILLDKELRRVYDSTRDYSDATVQFQNGSFGNRLAKLPCPKKTSDDILKDIAKWKDEFGGLVFNNNIQDSLTKILDEIINDHAPIREDNDAFYCKICDKLFVSEDDHFDNVLEPYIDEIIGNEKDDANDVEFPKIFDFLLKKLEPHDKLPTFDSKDIDVLLSAADKALKMTERNRALNLYHEAVTILSTVGDDDEHDVFQILLSIIIKVFDNDDYSLVYACKFLLASYIDQFSSSETIQDIFRRKFMKETDLSSYKMALASLHYLPELLNSDTWDEFVSWEQNLFYDAIKEAMNNVNHDSLLEILKLVNCRTVNPVEIFINEKHEDYDLTGITGDYKVAILLIEGTVAKQRGEVTSAADIFQETVKLAATCSNRQISGQIVNMAAELCADPIFHHSLRINARSELVDLKSTLVNSGEVTNVQRFPSFLSPIDPATPGQIKLGRLYAPTGNLRVALKNEDAIAVRFKDSYFKKALAYFDLSVASGQSRFLISCNQQAVCYLLKEMECLDSNNDKATVYAYSKVIEKQCSLTSQVASLYGGPYMSISVHRFIASALLASVTALAKCLSTEKPSLENPDICDTEIIPSAFKASVNKVWTLQKVNPLIMYPCSIALSDQLILENWTNAFQNAFIEAKVNSLHYPDYFPDHLYNYYQFDSVWLGWNRPDKPIELHESRLAAMMSLLNAKEWDIAEVERNMGWPLIRTTDSGWKNNEELNSTTGAFEIYFDRGQTGVPKLFSTNDLAEIFENCIDDAFFTLESPDPSLNSHPFQEFSYWPHSLKGTDYLHTLLHADLLLKEFTTGVEINTLAPFDLRPIKDGFMQRLPPHLQSLLIPILERHRNPINFSPKANRFWIQIESIECKKGEGSVQEASKHIFGHVTVKVNTHVLTRGPDGKYKDVEEKQILDSAENQFARAFTKHYDEIGKYFPVLLRLKELAKIGAIRKHLGAVLGNSRTSIDALTTRDESSEILKSINHCVETTITSFRDRERNPPHPIYTEEKVKMDLTEVLRKNNVLGKEFLVAPGEIDRVKQAIRNNLMEADISRFQFCANELGRCFEIPPDSLKQYIRGWFDRNPTDTSTLQRLCIDGQIQAHLKSMRMLASGLEEGGIIVPKDHNGIVEMKNYGECSWVPATFCKEFACPVEPPLLSDESDIEYFNEVDDENDKKGSADVERRNLHQSGAVSIQAKQNLQLPCEKDVPALCVEQSTTTAVSTIEPTETAKKIEVLGKYDDTVQSEAVPVENDIPSSAAAKDGTAQTSGSKKRRKIHKPRLVKPPRIYGGVSVNPRVNWVDVGLTVVTLLPLGRLFAVGGRLLRGTFQAFRLAKAASVVTKGIQASGRVSGVGRYSTLTKQSTMQVHAHHSVANAYNRQFGIKKGQGISILLNRGVHTTAHREVGKVWKSKGLLKGNAKVPTFDASNSATYPRNILGQMTMAERQALRQNGLYGTDTRRMLAEKIRQNKTSFKEMYDKSLFDPKNPPKF